LSASGPLPRVKGTFTSQQRSIADIAVMITNGERNVPDASVASRHAEARPFFMTWN